MKVYFTPGPSQLHHTYEFHLKSALRNQLGSISHRGAEFQQIYRDTELAVRELLQVPDNFTILFLSSATDIWERIIQNLVIESSHHFINGAFSSRFFQFAQDLGKRSSATESNGQSEFENFIVPSEAELIGITQNETSIGYSFDPERLKEIRKENPEKLIALDVVSSGAAVPIDFESIDMAYLSVQKCFGLPAGLGVWIINEKAIEIGMKNLEDGKTQGTYRSITSLVKYAKKHQTPETPNVMSIYLLGKVAEEMISRGSKIIQNETIYKSTILYQTLENHSFLAPFIRNKQNRSKTVIVAECGEKQNQILSYFEKMRFVIGKGYGEYKTQHLRIANFPAHSKEQIEMLCDHLEKIS